MSSGKGRFLAALLFSSIPLLFFWSTGLFDFDEGVYAAVLGEMRRSGNWLIPTYYGEPWFEKPIMLYWLAGPSVAAFGDVVGPRLPSAACSIGTLAVCGWFVQRWVDFARARLTMWILGGSLLFTIVGNLLLADSILVFALTASLLCWIESIRSGNWLYRILCGLSLGVALLAKGPFVLIAMAVVWSWTALAEKRLGRTTSKGAFEVAAIALAVGCVWYVPALLADRATFIESFVLVQNIGRLMGGDDAHRVPLWLYLPYHFLVLGVTFAPWVYLLRRSWPGAPKADEEESAFIKRILARFAIIVVAIFTIGGSKLPHYVLPALPPLAVLLGLSLGETPVLRLRFDRLAFATVVFCAAVNLYLFPKYYTITGQRQVHGIAEYAKQNRLPLATYLIRSPLRDAAIKGELQDTTLPSLNFYLDRLVPDFYALNEIERISQPTALLTRDGKLTKEDLARLEETFDLERIAEHSDGDEGQLPNGRYELYVLTRR